MEELKNSQAQLMQLGSQRLESWGEFGRILVKWWVHSYSFFSPHDAPGTNKPWEDLFLTAQQSSKLKCLYPTSWKKSKQGGERKQDVWKIDNETKAFHEMCGLQSETLIYIALGVVLSRTEIGMTWPRIPGMHSKLQRSKCGHHDEIFEGQRLTIIAHDFDRHCQTWFIEGDFQTHQGAFQRHCWGQLRRREQWSNKLFEETGAFWRGKKCYVPLSWNISAPASTGLL